MNEPKTDDRKSSPDENGAEVKAAARQSESEYLSAQAETAKAAITHALLEAKTALAEGLDPKEWTRRYPLIAIGSAAAAGFVAALLAIPSKEQQELKRLAKLHRAMHPEADTTKTPAEESPNQKPAARSMWITLLLEATSLIRPLLISAITSLIRPPPKPPPQNPDPTKNSQAP